MDLGPVEDVKDHGARPGEIELERGLVDRGRLADVLVVDAPHLAVLDVFVVHPLEALLDFLRGHRFAVVELETWPQVNLDHRLVVVELPALGEVRLWVETSRRVLGQRVPERGIEDRLGRSAVGRLVSRRRAACPASSEDAAARTVSADGRLLRRRLLLLSLRLRLLLLLWLVGGLRLGLLLLLSLYRGWLTVVIVAAANERDASSAQPGPAARLQHRAA